MEVLIETSIAEIKVHEASLDKTIVYVKPRGKVKVKISAEEDNDKMKITVRKSISSI